MDKDQLRTQYTYSKDYLTSFASLECCRSWPDDIDPAVQREFGNKDQSEWITKPLLDSPVKYVSSRTTGVLPDNDNKEHILAQATRISSYEDVSSSITKEIIKVSGDNDSPKEMEQQHTTNFIQRDDSGGTSGISNNTSSTTLALEIIFGKEARSIVPIPAAPTVQDIEAPELSKIEKFLTCQDVEEYLVMAGPGEYIPGDKLITLPRTNEDGNNVELRAASEHILSLLHPKKTSTELGESKLLGQLVSKSSISPDLSNLDGILQGYEQKNNTRSSKKVQHDTVDSLRTCVNRGGSRDVGKLRQVGDFEPPRELKVECIVEHNSLKGEEKLSDPSLKDFETAFETGSLPKEVKNVMTRKTFGKAATASPATKKHMHQQHRTYNKDYLLNQQQVLQHHQPVVPSTSFMWQTLPWQQITLQPAVIPTTMLHCTGFPATVSPPLVPQALQTLQRLVDHQLDILNNIPGEVTPGMLHQRLTRSIWPVSQHFQHSSPICDKYYYSLS